MFGYKVPLVILSSDLWTQLTSSINLLSTVRRLSYQSCIGFPILGSSLQVILSKYALFLNTALLDSSKFSYNKNNYQFLGLTFIFP